MRKSKFAPEQILQALRQAENRSTAVIDICRKMGVTETTFYRWRKQYAGLDVSELRELKQLREEPSPRYRGIATLAQVTAEPKRLETRPRRRTRVTHPGGFST